MRMLDYLQLGLGQGLLQLGFPLCFLAEDCEGRGSATAPPEASRTLKSKKEKGLTPPQQLA